MRVRYVHACVHGIYMFAGMPPVEPLDRTCAREHQWLRIMFLRSESLAFSLHVHAHELVLVVRNHPDHGIRHACMPQPHRNAHMLQP
jgi:hypothetical protein